MIPQYSLDVGIKMCPTGIGALPWLIEITPNPPEWWFCSTTHFSEWMSSKVCICRNDSRLKNHTQVKLIWYLLECVHQDCREDRQSLNAVLVVHTSMRVPMPIEWRSFFWKKYRLKNRYTDKDNTIGQLDDTVVASSTTKQSDATNLFTDNNNNCRRLSIMIMKISPYISNHQFDQPPNK